jgi:KRAB domain-containing zinc finger protein
MASTTELQKCCRICNYKTNQPNNLYRHIRSVHGYVCNKCDFTSIFKRDLQRHIILNHQQKSCICSLCNYTASTYEKLFLHIKEQHNSIKYQCPYCSYNTKWRTNLHKHVRKIHKNF